MEISDNLQLDIITRSSLRKLTWYCRFLSVFQVNDKSEDRLVAEIVRDGQELINQYFQEEGVLP